MLKFEFPTDIERKLFKQLDFALVLTFTRAAYTAQKAVRESLPQHFVLRNSFVSKGIQAEKATKQNPVATVFARTEGPFNIDFMLLQETGGTKTPKGQHLAIAPYKSIRQHKPAKQGKRPRDLLKMATHSTWAPGRALKDRKTVNIGFRFMITESTPHRYSHGMPPGIYERTWKGSAKNGKSSLILLFQFKRKVPVEAKFKFRETAIKAAIDAMPKLFEDALIQAVKTAR
jgi:hypothetical protein